MADEKTIPLQSTSAKSATSGTSGTSGTSSAPSPENVLALSLTPSDRSDHPILANTSHVQVAPGMCYIDFGFVEPGVLAALPRAAQQGATLPKQINGRLAARIVMGYDGIAALQQQLTRVMKEVAKATQQVQQAQKQAATGSKRTEN